MKKKGYDIEEMDIFPDFYRKERDTAEESEHEEDWTQYADSDSIGNSMDSVFQDAFAYEDEMQGHENPVFDDQTEEQKADPGNDSKGDRYDKNEQENNRSDESMKNGSVAETESEADRRFHETMEASDDASEKKSHESKSSFFPNTDNPSESKNLFQDVDDGLMDETIGGANPSRTGQGNPSRNNTNHSQDMEQNNRSGSEHSAENRSEETTERTGQEERQTRSAERTDQSEQGNGRTNSTQSMQSTQATGAPRYVRSFRDYRAEYSDMGTLGMVIGALAFAKDMVMGAVAVVATLANTALRHLLFGDRGGANLAKAFEQNANIQRTKAEREQTAQDRQAESREQSPVQEQDTTEPTQEHAPSIRFTKSELSLVLGNNNIFQKEGLQALASPDNRDQIILAKYKIDKKGIHFFENGKRLNAMEIVKESNDGIDRFARVLAENKKLDYTKEQVQRDMGMEAALIRAKIAMTENVNLVALDALKSKPDKTEMTLGTCKWDNRKGSQQVDVTAVRKDGNTVIELRSDGKARGEISVSELLSDPVSKLLTYDDGHYQGKEPYGDELDDRPKVRFNSSTSRAEFAYDDTCNTLHVKFTDKKTQNETRRSYELDASDIAEAIANDLHDNGFKGKGMYNSHVIAAAMVYSANPEIALTLSEDQKSMKDCITQKWVDARSSRSIGTVDEIGRATLTIETVENIDGAFALTKGSQISVPTFKDMEQDREFRKEYLQFIADASQEMRSNKNYTKDFEEDLVHSVELDMRSGTDAQNDAYMQALKQHVTDSSIFSPGQTYFVGDIEAERIFAEQAGNDLFDLFEQDIDAIPGSNYEMPLPHHKLDETELS